MNRLEQLLAAWEDGTLTAADAAELKQLLADPAARRALVEDWMFYEALIGALQSQPGEQPAAPRAASPAPAWHAPIARWFAQLAWPGWAVGGAAAALLLALGLVFLLPRSEPVAQIATLQGGVEVLHGSKAASPASQQWIQSGDILRLAAQSAVVITWPGEPTLVKVTGPAELVVPRQKGAKTLELRGGKLLAVVAPQPAKKPMNIRTPQAEAVVKGTRFTLAVNRTTTRLEVLEGAVALRKPDTARDALTVGAGSFAEAGPDAGWQTSPIYGSATREVIDQAPNDAPLAATGALVWQEYVTSLQAQGWPMGAARKTTAQYLQRLRGFLIVPSDGEYSFWMSSGSAAEFRLSTDEKPANARQLIAITAPNQPANAARSAPQKLLAGSRLYFEVSQHFAADAAITVGWNRPGVPNGGSLVEIIPGECLQPWTGGER